MGACFQLVREGFHQRRTAQRIDHICDTRLVGQHLLRAQRQTGRAFGRQRQRFVHAVGVQRLRAAKDGGQGLDRDAYHIGIGLLRGQHRAGGLRMEAQHPALVVARTELLAHDARPHAARGAELGDLFEEVVVRVEEEGQARCELIHRQTGFNGSACVGATVTESEGQLLRGARACFTDVIAADRDGVPLRNFLRAPRHQVGGQTHRRPRGETIVPARGVLLQDVVLHRAAQLAQGHAATLGNGAVVRQQDGGRCVDGHRGGDLI